MRNTGSAAAVQRKDIAIIKWCVAREEMCRGGRKNLGRGELWYAALLDWRKEVYLKRDFRVTNVCMRKRLAPRLLEQWHGTLSDIRKPRNRHGYEVFGCHTATL